MSATLADAVERIEGHPAAMNLRILSATAEFSSERNSTLVFTCPGKS
ncbi:hypothetical protein ACF07S_17615 [Streptomyces sp. NPDC016640]